MSTMTQTDIIWVVEEQTKIKHQLLNDYLGAWMAILFQQQDKIGTEQKLVYFDGFAGPGIYWTDESKKETVPGSPIIAAQLANAGLDRNPKREMVIIGIDTHVDRVASLQAELDKINRHKQHWKATSGAFEEEVNRLFDQLQKEKATIAPAFFFIDPFGYSGFKMATLKRVLAHPRTELFINLMIYDIGRFLDESHAIEAMRDLFGTDRYADAVKLNGDPRATFLMDLYCRQLQTIAGAKFVLPFRVNTPAQGTRPKYFLIHASQNLKALKVMKNAMRRNSTQPFRFEAIGLSAERQLDLFRPSGEQQLQDEIFEYIKTKGTRVTYEQVENWATRLRAV